MKFAAISLIMGAAALFLYTRGDNMNLNKTVEQMAYEKARSRLILREGYRTKVYKDSEGFLTVGIGHKVTAADGLNFGDIITDAQVEALFKKDMDKAFSAALTQAKDLGRYTIDFIAALTSVNFQLGTNWPQKFYTTYPLLRAGNWQQVIVNLQNSLWARQTPVRVADFINTIKDEYIT